MGLQGYSGAAQKVVTALVLGVLSATAAFDEPPSLDVTSARAEGALFTTEDLSRWKVKLEEPVFDAEGLGDYQDGMAACPAASSPASPATAPGACIRW